MQLANKIFFSQVEAELAKGQEVQLRVKGYSMRPLLRNERATVVLTPYGNEELRRGDIVLFRYNDKHILHRIVQLTPTRITLQGDGNYHQQEHCTTQDVLAVVRCVIYPHGRVIACQSRLWKFLSRLWLTCPALLRRYTLALLFRLGYK
ncbi:MAG: S26 family signal peptidase [Alistipes sp.]